MPKLNNITNSVMSNPLVVVVIMLLLVIVILGIIRMVMPSFSAGVGVNAHLGTIKGSINLEAFENTEELESFMNSNSPQFVIFKADWCGHCKKVLPEIQKLESMNLCQVVKVDADKQPDLVKEHGVQGFPTIRLYPQGLGNKSSYEDFTGERTAESMKVFLQRLLNN